MPIAYGNVVILGATFDSATQSILTLTYSVSVPNSTFISVVANQLSVAQSVNSCLNTAFMQINLVPVPTVTVPTTTSTITYSGTLLISGYTQQTFTNQVVTVLKAGIALAVRGARLMHTTPALLTLRCKDLILETFSAVEHRCPRGQRRHSECHLWRSPADRADPHLLHLAA